jgi:hypothetical protein
LVGVSTPAPGLWAFKFGEPGASLVAPYRIPVTSLSYDDKSGFLEIGTRFGESPDLIGLDQSGGVSNINCIVSDGNTQGARIAQFGRDKGAVVNAMLAGKPHDSLLQPTPFQRTNRGGFESFILGLDSGTAGADFSLGFDQSTVSRQAGTKARLTVNINRIGGFTGNVTVTPADPSGGIKPKPADPITTPDASVTFKLKIGGGVAPGRYDRVSRVRTIPVGRAPQQLR